VDLSAAVSAFARFIGADCSPSAKPPTPAEAAAADEPALPKPPTHAWLRSGIRRAKPIFGRNTTVTLSTRRKSLGAIIILGSKPFTKATYSAPDGRRRGPPPWTASGRKRHGTSRGRTS